MLTNKTIGFIGAGKLAVTLGNLAIEAGYDVLISSSRTVEEIKLTVETLVPGAVAATNNEVAKEADVVILALPLSKYQELDRHMFNGKLVFDAMNYWWEVDGLTNIYSDENESSSEKVAAYFTGSKVVKAFNHISYHNLADYADQSSKEHQIAVLFSTNHKEKIIEVETIINDFGFTAKYIGELANGRILETGYPLFGASMRLDKIMPLVDESLKTIINNS